MSWLDFTNHFLSNQRLHAWSWINRTSLGNGFFWWVFRLLCVFGFWFSWLFLFLFFCLVRGEKKGSLAHGILVGNQREKTTFRSWFPFLSFVHLVTILYCSDIVRSKDLSAHFFFFSFDPWSGAFFPSSSSFFTFSHSLIGNFLSFLFAFSHSLIGNSLSSLFFLWLEIFLLFFFCFRG